MAKRPVHQIQADEVAEFTVHNGCRIVCSVEKRNKVTVLRVRSIDGQMLVLPDTANQIAILPSRNT